MVQSQIKTIIFPPRKDIQFKGMCFNRRVVETTMISLINNERVELMIGSCNTDITNNPGTNYSRRRFIKISAIGFVTTPLVVQLLLGTAAQAAGRSARNPPPAGIPALDENDEQAKALHYFEDANDADKIGRKPNQLCQVCQLYSGKPGAEWGPCAIFSYRRDPKTNTPLVVNANGWCQGWGPRASAS